MVGLSTFGRLLFNKKIGKTIWFTSLTVLSVVPYISSILFSPISLDGSYYLSIVERIREGLIPYRDFTLEYTPVLFYITAFFKNIFSIGINYSFDLGIHFCFQLMSAYLLFKIALLLLLSKVHSYYVSVFYLLISFWITQYEFILEIPSLMWGFWAIYMTIKHKEKTLVYIIVGCIASLSFLTKQYGLGFLFLIIYLIIFNSNRWKQLMFLVIGYSIPIILFSCFVPEITNVFFGNGYGNQVNNESNGLLIDTAKRMGAASSYFLYRVPILLFAIVLFPVIDQNERKNAGLLLFGIGGFMFQFMFANFNHYDLYIIPFASLYIFMILSSIKKNGVIYKTYFFVLLVVFGFAFLKIYSRILSSDIDLRNNQLLLANKIKEQIEPGESVYIADVRLVDLYYPMNVKPTNMRYTFGLTMTEELHYKQLREADYILTYETPDVENFDYLNSVRVQKFVREIPHKKVIESQVYFDKYIKKNIKQRILLYKNQH